MTTNNNCLYFYNILLVTTRIYSITGMKILRDIIDSNFRSVCNAVATKNNVNNKDGIIWYKN